MIYSLTFQNLSFYPKLFVTVTSYKIKTDISWVIKRMYLLLQEKLPLPPTEILKTWADISTSTALLGFNPKTDLKTGKDVTFSAILFFIKL